MQVILEPDEAWSLMMVIASSAIDKSGVSQDGKQAIRRWRSDHAQGSPLMDEMAEAMNAALGGYIDEKTNRMVKRKGRHVRKKERA